MIVMLANTWRPVSLPRGVTEPLAEALLQTLGYDACSIPESAADIMREEPVDLIELCHEEYIRGELFIDTWMEWVSCDERHTMLVFGGHIIATVETLERNDAAGTFKERIRWFQCQQFVLTHEDI